MLDRLLQCDRRDGRLLCVQCVAYHQSIQLYTQYGIHVICFIDNKSVEPYIFVLETRYRVVDTLYLGMARTRITKTFCEHLRFINNDSFLGVYCLTLG